MRISRSSDASSKMVVALFAAATLPALACPRADFC
jgi:hypothetical protein